MKIRRMHSMKRFFPILALVLLTGLPHAHALFSTMDTGDILPAGMYDVGLETQFGLGGDYPSGANFLGHFDMPGSEDINFKFIAGGGSLPFEAGGFVKYVPFPDLESQPAIGMLGGVVFSRSSSGTSMLNLRLHPLVSKKFDTQIGELTPFLSLPIGITFASGATTYPFQIAPGTRWRPAGYKNLSFMTELGINLNAAFSYISFGAIVPFDESGAFHFD